MKSVKFTVPGPPVPKARPRYAPGGGKPWTPTKTKKFQEHVGARALEAGARVSKKPFMAIITFWFHNALRRDLDNCAKSVLDGLNGIAWHDDSQVWQLRCSRGIDRDNPRTEVELREMDSVDQGTLDLGE